MHEQIVFILWDHLLHMFHAQTIVNTALANLGTTKAIKSAEFKSITLMELLLKVSIIFQSINTIVSIEYEFIMALS